MNFAIEVFALHIRNLLDFFAPRYAARPTRAPRTSIETAGARAERLPAGSPPDGYRHVAHLTTDRTSDVDLKTWAVEPIVCSLVPIIEYFAKGTELVREIFESSWRSESQSYLPGATGTELPPQPDVTPS